MQRKIMAKLAEWRANKNSRLPLLLYGARQVGKTYILQEFGKQYFQNTVYVNFEEDKILASYLEMRLQPDYIIRTIEELYNVKIEPETTLLIFDEIQSCARALTSLKYFAEQVPEYCVVAAGSLLGVVINRENHSFPVGKVQIMRLYPLDLEEYLWAMEKTSLAQLIRVGYINNHPLPELLHQEALQLYREYLLTGGMPAVVKAKLSGADTYEIKGFIYNSYVADMAKYASKGESVKIAEAYDSLPAQLAKDNKKFQYKLIRTGARSSLYGNSLDWLIQAGVVLKCAKCEQGRVPLAAYEDLSSFKLYFSDTGLFSYRLKLTQQNLPYAQQFMGALTENYVAVQLLANGHELHYWESQSTAEVDFIITGGEQIIPIECKANLHVKSKSLLVFNKRYSIQQSIRLSGRNFGLENSIKSVPLYAAWCI
ncbi:MAG: ATP-binding protein [Phascolarctobacterium sp.]